MTKLFTVAEMMGRDLARRRMALALLALISLVFYLGRHDANPEKAIRFAGLGLAWAVSTAGLFVSNTTKSAEARLRQIGYLPAHLYLGALTALSAAWRPVLRRSHPGHRRADRRAAPEAQAHANPDRCAVI